MSDRFWNFSKAERISAIVLTAIIVVILVSTFFVKSSDSTPTKDYSEEIEEFKGRVIEKDTIKEKSKKSKKRQKKVYTPNKQELSPLQKENR